MKDIKTFTQKFFLISIIVNVMIILMALTWLAGKAIIALNIWMIAKICLSMVVLDIAVFIVIILWAIMFAVIEYNEEWKKPL
jgi:hypothetical protein